MFIASTLETVRAQYPVEFEAAIASFRKSKSKRRLEPLVSFAWGYEFCVQVTGFSFNDVLSGEAARQREAQQALSFEDKVRDYEKRVGARIVGKLLGRITVESGPLGKVPAVILDEYRKQELAREAEGRRFAALSPEQQERELNRAVRQLSKDPGFAAFAVVPRKD